MKIKPSTLYTITLFFPLTGIFGVHKIIIGKYLQFFVRLITFYVFVIWIYDMFTVKSALEEFKARKRKEVENIIELIENGDAKKGWRKFLLSGEVSHYAGIMVELGRSDIMIGSVKDDKKATKALEEAILKNDMTEFVVTFIAAITSKYLGLGLFD